MIRRQPAAIAAHPHPPRTLIEIDSGEERGGLTPGSDRLLEIANRLGSRLAGVMTHAGHSYGGRTVRDMERIAEQERNAVTAAAQRLRQAGHRIDIVSAGSSPTARHAENLSGVTEVRAGVYMFGDLFQAEIETHGADAIAVTVLTSVIGRRPGSVLVDAGGLALSKDRSTQDGAARLRLRPGARSRRPALLRQRHRPTRLPGARRHRDGSARPIDLPVGGRLRIAPNHVCMTAAAHDRYFVYGRRTGGSRHLASGQRLVVSPFPTGISRRCA